MEYWLDIGKDIFHSDYSYDIECQWSSEENLIVFLKELRHSGIIYRIDFGPAIYCEIIDEHLSFPPFLNNQIIVDTEDITRSVLFEIKSGMADSIRQYFIRTDFYVLVKSYSEPIITVVQNIE